MARRSITNTELRSYRVFVIYREALNICDASSVPVRYKHGRKKMEKGKWMAKRKERQKEVGTTLKVYGRKDKWRRNDIQREEENREGKGAAVAEELLLVELEWYGRSTRRLHRVASTANTSRSIA